MVLVSLGLKRVFSRFQRELSRLEGRLTVFGFLDLV